MKKREIVKKKKFFSEIINNGNKISNKYFSIFFIDQEDDLLFGIAVPTKIGNAVVRNTLKRRTRSIIDQTKSLFKKKRKYIIIIKEACLNSDFNKILESFKTLIGEINEKEK